MKRTTILILICLFLVSCSKKDRLLSQAKRDAKEMIEKKAMEPENFNRDIRLEDIMPVYEGDSLCILYLTVNFKNALGMDTNQRVEFVHFGDYWFTHIPDNDKGETTIYLPEESFAKEKKGRIYENYQYDDAIYYRAALHLNKQNKDGYLDIPIKTGLWELENYKDSYNEDTDNNYLLLSSFYCSAEDEKYDIKAELIIDQETIFFRLWRRLSGDFSIASNDGTFTLYVEESSGESHGPWIFRKTDKGIVPSKNKKQIVEQMKKILEREGIITIKSHNDGFWWKSRIKFKMNLAGYNEAKRLLKKRNL